MLKLVSKNWSKEGRSESAESTSSLGTFRPLLMRIHEKHRIDDLTLTLLAKDLDCEPASLVQLFKKIRAQD